MIPSREPLHRWCNVFWVSGPQDRSPHPAVGVHDADGPGAPYRSFFKQAVMKTTRISVSASTPSPPRSRSATRSGGAAVLLLAGILAVAGCGPAQADRAKVPEPAPSASMPASPQDPLPELTAFYAQHPVWSPCGQGAECAEMEVPLDYDAPAEGRISLAVKRVRSTGSAEGGALLVNFGGPGASGTALVEGFAAGMASPELLAAYEVVGFDPRGVGSSTPVECVDDAGLDALRAARYDFDTTAGLAEYATAARDFARACERNTGSLLGEVDTVSAARDLDIVRAVLGQAKLDYLGYSYGTLLGATYADLFPQRTGRLVLDGAVDPSISYAEITAAQATGFEAAMRAYAESCTAGADCPLTGGPDEAVAQVRALLDRAEATPLPTADGRELTSRLAATGILVGLYDDQLWPVLTGALAQALHAGDGSELMFLADVVAQRQPDGSYLGNYLEVQPAINCLDYPMEADPAAMAAEAARFQEASPTFGHLLGYSAIRCQDWPYEPTGRPGPITAEGAAPILVVGTTGDPATPYAWAEALAGQLASGHLLTWQGRGHTAYGRADECLEDAVDAYLIEGTLPPEDLTCGPATQHEPDRSSS